MKEKIPVYKIANLTARPLDPGDFMIEGFQGYLGRQSPHLHSPHRHVFYHLVCFKGGTGHHSIDFTRYPVEEGQIYFMTLGQVHSWSFTSQPEGYVVNFSENFLRNFLLSPNYLERFSFFSGNSQDSVVQMVSPVKEKVYGILDSMLEHYYNHAEKDPDLLRTLLLQLFLTVQNGIETAKPTAQPAVSQKQQLLASFKKLIEQHYKTLRRPSEYAELLFITPNHLNALCQELLGRAAGEVIRDRVLLEAKRLLTNAGMTATEIAYELNFQDNSYFNRFFKKYEGVTPDEFRKAHIMK
ncbi:AraC family transcriptional regulator [Puia sp. P3]|uniref:AraC family transcriptional regulator n=1 Tax=Puia sp. P3 TaxID=3423952 RepID=UPI003D673216